MFKQFAMARFLIGFVVFILAYMVASMSYDIFFHFLTAGMFILVLWIMREMQSGVKEQLAKNDAQWEERLNDMQEQLDMKEQELNLLRDASHNTTDNQHSD
jgi:hypothetical protein